MARVDTRIPGARRSYTDHMQRGGIIFALALTLALPAGAQTPDEAYLGTRAPELRALVDDARRVALPADLLVAKAREGVAKGVAPARILSVVRELAAALAIARSDAQPFVGATPPAALVKALVEARAAGASAADTIAVLRANGREHALDVLTDLLLRGCPPATATRAVTSLAGRDRALDALTLPAHAGAQSLSLEHGEANLHATDDVSDDNGRGPSRETSGARGPRSGGVTPEKIR
jgi:hypothetical protein